MNDIAAFNAVAANIRETSPLYIRYKTESRFMRAIGWFLGLFNKAFMTQYTTTIDNAVYFPHRADVESNSPPWPTLAHETMHVRDAQHRSKRFKLSYLFPQCLAPLALFAVLAVWFSPAWLYALVFLVALAPLPAPWRVHWERRGYLMTTVCNVLRYGASYVQAPEYRSWLADQFTGWAYYKMAWSREHIEVALRADIARAVAIAQGRRYEPPYSSIADAIRKAL